MVALSPHILPLNCNLQNHLSSNGKSRRAVEHGAEYSIHKVSCALYRAHLHAMSAETVCLFPHQSNCIEIRMRD